MHPNPAAILRMIEDQTDNCINIIKLATAPIKLPASNLAMPGIYPVNRPVRSSNKRVVMKFSVNRYSPYIIIFLANAHSLMFHFYLTVLSYFIAYAKLVEPCDSFKKI